MQIHISPEVTDGELFVHMNPGAGDPFGVIKFGQEHTAYIDVESDEDADRIIRAAERIKQMRAAMGLPHAYDRGPDGTYCGVCGLLEKDGPHGELSVRERALRGARKAAVSAS